MKIILFQPQIPQNTGNIVRTCSVTGTGLVLVPPLGFSTHSRHLKRAGLDYWEGVDVEQTRDLKEYLNTSNAPFFFFSSKVEKSYFETPYTPNSLLIFGSESGGLPKEYFDEYPDKFYTIPMLEGSRCLNLATSAAIVLYEALRSTHFFSLQDHHRTTQNHKKNANVLS